MTRLRRRVSVAIFDKDHSGKMLIASAAFASYVIVGPQVVIITGASYGIEHELAYQLVCARIGDLVGFELSRR
jgi:hypothetical protein